MDPYIDLVTENILSLEEKSLLKDVNLAMKSEQMKSLRDFQKRKYPRILGIQGERRISNNSLDNLQQHISNIDEVNDVMFFHAMEAMSSVAHKRKLPVDKAVKVGVQVPAKVNFFFFFFQLPVYDFIKNKIQDLIYK